MKRTIRVNSGLFGGPWLGIGMVVWTVVSMAIAVGITNIVNRGSRDGTWQSWVIYFITWLVVWFVWVCIQFVGTVVIGVIIYFLSRIRYWRAS